MNSSTDNQGRGAIFDLDGTLLDSMGVWGTVDDVFFARRGIECPDDYQRIISPMAFPDIAAYTIERFHLPDTPRQVMDEWNDLALDQYANHVPLKKGAREYLEWLHDSGARLSVASTLLPTLREPTLERLGIRGLFDAVCGIEEVGGLNKDKPDLYLECARRMNVEPPQCTVFEDILAGIRTAKNAGMKAWAVYDESSGAPDFDEITALADGTMRDFTQAPRLL